MNSQVVTFEVQCKGGPMLATSGQGQAFHHGGKGQACDHGRGGPPDQQQSHGGKGQAFQHGGKGQACDDGKGAKGVGHLDGKGGHPDQQQSFPPVPPVRAPAPDAKGLTGAAAQPDNLNKGSKAATDVQQTGKGPDNSSPQDAKANPFAAPLLVSRQMAPKLHAAGGLPRNVGITTVDWLLPVPKNKLKIKSAEYQIL